jgi:hypothetical protein
MAHAHTRPKQTHSDMDLCRERQDPTSKQKPLLLPGGYRLRQTPTVRSGARGNAHLPLPYLFLSIASPRVHHSALHSGSDSHKEFGLHSFPKSVLQQLDVAPGIKLLSPFTLPLRSPSGDAPEATHAWTAIPKNFTIMFGAHRASVYGSSAAAKSAAFAAAAKDPVRESHAKDFIHKSV